MKQITGEAFIEAIEKDPSWCLSIKEPLEVTTFIYMINSNITHLSPLITFKGANNKGKTADFYGCPITYVPKEYRIKEFIFPEGVIKNSIERDKIIKNTIEKIKLETNNIEI